jgi:polyketide cyclase/dehydrase/lipid transport protein
MLLKIIIGVAVVVVLLTIFIASRPAEFSVTRSAAMAATPAAVFSQVNDFHKWEAWSPWAKMDPNATSTFEGPSSGEDAKFAWDGNKDIGAGNMTITESVPNDHIRIRLEFVRPFAGVNDTLFTFKPVGDKTNVTWTMSGRNNFMTKAIGLFMNCDKMVGDQFEKGLANMEALAASESK